MNRSSSSFQFDPEDVVSDGIERIFCFYGEWYKFSQPWQYYSVIFTDRRTFNIRNNQHIAAVTCQLDFVIAIVKQI